jgi:glycolate oxidase FAD binding subunit
LAEASAFLTCALPDLESADRLLSALITSRTTPAAIELLAGEAWQSDPALGPGRPEAPFRLVVGLEGSRAEVDWMQDQLAREWADQGVPQHRLMPAADVPGLWQRLTEFQTGQDAALVVKFNVLPSRVCGLVTQLLETLPDCSVQAHAASGIVLTRLASRPADVQGLLVKQLQPAAIRAGGRAVVWANPSGEDLTRQAFWGTAGGDVELMRAVKRQFDPSHLLNPGRFVYGI